MLDILSYGIELFARVLLTAPFLYSARMTALNMPYFLKEMEEKNLPSPKFLLYASQALRLSGAFGIIFGVYEAFFAFALALFVTVASAIFHDFWNHQGERRATETLWFISNAGLVGGLLLLGSMKMPLYL